MQIAIDELKNKKGKNNLALAERHGNCVLLLIPSQGRKKKSSRAND